MKHRMTILGTTLLFSVGEVRVLSAQEQGAGPAASETEPAKHDASSRADAPLNADAIARTHQRALIFEGELDKRSG
jgi:hypothetical protein